MSNQSLINALRPFANVYRKWDGGNIHSLISSLIAPGDFEKAFECVLAADMGIDHEWIKLDDDALPPRLTTVLVASRGGKVYEENGSVVQDLWHACALDKEPCRYIYWQPMPIAPNVTSKENK